MLPNITNWWEWIRLIPSAVEDIARGLSDALAGGQLSGDEVGRLRALQPTYHRWVTSVTGRTDVITYNVYDAALANEILKDPHAPDEVLLRRAEGQDTDGANATIQEIKEAFMKAGFWDKSESARNGFGGGAPVRRG